LILKDTQNIDARQQLRENNLIKVLRGLCQISFKNGEGVLARLNTNGPMLHIKTTYLLVQSLGRLN
jgi:hypothetical protein